LATELATLRDVYQACILIGTNDVGNGSDPDLFEEYYRQVLRALQLSGLRVAYCGEIPPRSLSPPRDWLYCMAISFGQRLAWSYKRNSGTGS